MRKCLMVCVLLVCPVMCAPSVQAEGLPNGWPTEVTVTAPAGDLYTGPERFVLVWTGHNYFGQDAGWEAFLDPDDTWGWGAPSLGFSDSANWDNVYGIWEIDPAAWPLSVVGVWRSPQGLEEPPGGFQVPEPAAGLILAAAGLVLLSRRPRSTLRP